MLLRLTLRPLLKYGIALEAHGQNILVRVDIRTHEIVGLAIRDFGGIKIHMPTLRQQGYDLRSALPGNVMQTDDLGKVWARTHHALFQIHLNQLIGALRLQHEGGWAVVREELKRFVGDEVEDRVIAKEMEEYFLRETMSMKCFLRMRMEGIYRTVSFTSLLHSICLGEKSWLANDGMWNSHSISIETCRISCSAELQHVLLCPKQSRSLFKFFKLLIHVACFAIVERRKVYCRKTMNGKPRSNRAWLYFCFT